MEKLTQGFHSVPVLYFRGELVGHVENIGDLIHIGGNLCYMSRQCKLVQAMGDRKQNTDAILGKDLHDRKVVRSIVINVYHRCDLGHPLLQKERGLGRFLQTLDIDFTVQNAVQGCAELGPLLLAHDHFGSPMMGNPKNVEYAPVACSEDARVENVEIERGQYAANRGKQSRTVLSANDHRGTIAVGKMLHRDLCLLAAKAVHQLEVIRKVVFRCRKKVALR